MDSEVRQCPVCEARVLPSGDGSCPSCRKHNFYTGISSVPLPAESAAERRCKDLQEGASLHWHHVWTTCTLVGVLILLFATRGSALLYLCTAVAIAFHLYTARQLRQWLGIRGRRRSFMLLRDSLAEFEREGVPTDFMGPRVDARPRR